MEINRITEIIIQSACRVHTVLGPGLLERPYAVCLQHELLKQGMKALAEVTLPVSYDGVTIDIGYRLDLLVNDLVIVELKAVSQLSPIHKVQLLTYLKLSKKPVGLLLNFHVSSLKNGIVRLAN